MMMLAVSDSGNEASGGYQLTFQHWLPKNGLTHTHMHTHTEKVTRDKKILSLESRKHIEKLTCISKWKVSI